MSSVQFITFWDEFGSQDISERRRYLSTLTASDRRKLIDSFFKGGWDRFFVQQHVDNMLDKIKTLFGLDLIDLRIKAIKHQKTFLIEAPIWELIEDIFTEFDDYYDIDIIFGGLKVKKWGQFGQYYRIRGS